MPTQAGEAHEYIAQLMLDLPPISGVHCSAELGHLFFHLFEDLAGLRPVKSGCRGLLALAMGSKQARKAGRNTRQAGAPGSLFSRLPCLDSTRIGLGLPRMKDVRMTCDHLFYNALCDGIQGQSASICADLRDQQDHEEHIAKLTLKTIFTGVNLHRLKELVDLLEEVRAHGQERLLTIPWASIRAAKRRNNLDELLKWRA